MGCGASKKSDIEGAKTQNSNEKTGDSNPGSGPPSPEKGPNENKPQSYRHQKKEAAAAAASAASSEKDNLTPPGDRGNHAGVTVGNLPPSEPSSPTPMRGGQHPPRKSGLNNISTDSHSDSENLNGPSRLTRAESGGYLISQAPDHIPMPKSPQAPKGMPELDGKKGMPGPILGPASGIESPKNRGPGGGGGLLLGSSSGSLGGGQNQQSQNTNDGFSSGPGTLGASYGPSSGGVGNLKSGAAPGMPPPPGSKKPESYRSANRVNVGGGQGLGGLGGINTLNEGDEDDEDAFDSGFNTRPQSPNFKKLQEVTNRHNLIRDEEDPGKELFAFDGRPPEKAQKNIIPDWCTVALGDVIGQGSHGTVYKGRREDTGQLVAVKATPVENPEAMDAMKKEVATLKMFNHPNCIDYLGSRSFSPPGTYEPTHIHVFLALVPGGSISEMLTAFGPITEKEEIASLTYQCTKGLAYLHMKGIVHRDLKGANVLLGTYGEAILTDMGTAFIAGRQGTRASEETMRLYADKTSALGADATIMMSTMCGSIPWMAPEVLTNQGYKKTADIWSLGGLVIEIGSGLPPWSEKKFDNPIALMMQLSMGQLPGMPDHFDDTVREFVAKCLSKQASDRPTAKQCMEHDFLRPQKEMEMQPKLFTSPHNFDWYDVEDFAYSYAGI